MTLSNYTYGSRELKLGDVGTDVLDLEIKLVAFGGKGATIECKGTFNKNTETAIRNFCRLSGLSAQVIADSKVYQAIESWVASESEFLTVFNDTFPCHCSNQTDSIKKKALKNWNKFIRGKAKHAEGTPISDPACTGFGNAISGAFQFEKGSDTIGRFRSELVEKPGFNKLLLWAILGARKILQEELSKTALGIRINNGYRCQLNYLDIIAQREEEAETKGVSISDLLIKKPVAMGNHLGNAVDLAFKACTPKQARELLKKHHAFYETLDTTPNRLRLEPLSKSPTWTHLDTTTFEYQIYVTSVADALEPRYAGQSNLPVSLQPSAVSPTSPSTDQSAAPSRADTLKTGVEAAETVRASATDLPQVGNGQTERAEPEDASKPFDGPDESEDDEKDAKNAGEKVGDAEFIEDESRAQEDAKPKEPKLSVDPVSPEVAHMALDSGLFPVGTNLTWHGGIHLHGSPNQPVQSMADGVVVAARLPEKDPANPTNGSRNFVLIKHRTPQGDDYWSLYMHLLPLALKDDDPILLKAMPWLFELQLDAVQGGSNIRVHPAEVSEAQPPRETTAGESFAVLDQRQANGGLWYQVESKKDGFRGWIAKTDRLKIVQAIKGLDDLKAGKVVKFDHPILHGTSVGFMSSPNPDQKPFVHWEVLSEKLASGGWGDVCDDGQDDVICDAEALKKLINKNCDLVVFMGPLTKDLVLAATKDPEKRKQIASRAYRFQSEWDVDWEKALQRYDKEVAKVQGPVINLYRFWQDALSAGCDLPKSSKVYHYSPLAFQLVHYSSPESPNEEKPAGTALPPAKIHKTSSVGIELILKHEGFRAKPYNDVAGHATIGYGTLLHKGSVSLADRLKYSNGITEAEARKLLEAALPEFESKLNKAIKVEINQNQFDALMDWVYNLGPGKLKEASCSWLRNLNLGKLDKVPEGLKLWDVAVVDGQKTHLPGLKQRRENEAALFTKT